MVLTDLQKRAIDTIISGEARDIETFFLKYFEKIGGLRDSGRPGEFEGRALIDVKAPDNFFVVSDKSGALECLGEFVVLRQKLTAANLVVIVPKKKDAILPLYYQPYDTDHLEPDFDSLSVLNQFNQESLVPTGDLRRFVEKGYLTVEEIESEEKMSALKEERGDRRKAQRWTQFLALASILVSAFSVIYQIATHKSSNEVTIKNEHAFPDTAKVLILERAGVKDTTAKP